MRWSCWNISKLYIWHITKSGWVLRRGDGHLGRGEPGNELQSLAVRGHPWDHPMLSCWSRLQVELSQLHCLQWVPGFSETSHPTPSLEELQKLSTRMLQGWRRWSFDLVILIIIDFSFCRCGWTSGGTSITAWIPEHEMLILGISLQGKPWGRTSSVNRSGEGQKFSFSWSEYLFDLCKLVSSACVSWIPGLEYEN